MFVFLVLKMSGKVEKLATIGEILAVDKVSVDLIPQKKGIKFNYVNFFLSFIFMPQT